MNALHNFLFIGFPYIALAVFLIGSIWRYRQTGFKYSSLSSQFLEGKKLFWGSVPFHFGILVVFLGHLTAFLFPKTTLAWNSQPVRLLILEVSAFIFGLSVLIGLVMLLVRRFGNDRLHVVTSKMDLLLEFALLTQVIFGCWIALGFRWGSSWFAADLSPYLWSIFTFTPKIAAVSAMPWVIQTHIVGAFLIIFLIPFTRLVHFLVAPFHYINRPYQQVIWHWDRKTVRSEKTVWSVHRPKNN